MPCILDYTHLICNANRSACVQPLATVVEALKQFMSEKSPNAIQRQIMKLQNKTAVIVAEYRQGVLEPLKATIADHLAQTDSVAISYDV